MSEFSVVYLFVICVKLVQYFNKEKNELTSIPYNCRGSAFSHLNPRRSSIFLQSPKQQLILMTLFLLCGVQSSAVMLFVLQNSLGDINALRERRCYCEGREMKCDAPTMDATHAPLEVYKLCPNFLRFGAICCKLKARTTYQWKW